MTSELHPARQHPDLPPVLLEFIPKGRAAIDVMFYKTMRRIARLKRREVYQLARDVQSDLMHYGTGYYKVDWK